MTRRRPGFGLGWATIIPSVALVASPVIVVLASILAPDRAMWARQWETRLPGMIVDTTALLVTVLVGTSRQVSEWLAANRTAADVLISDPRIDDALSAAANPATPMPATVARRPDQSAAEDVSAARSRLTHAPTRRRRS